MNCLFEKNLFNYFLLLRLIDIINYEYYAITLTHSISSLCLIIIIIKAYKKVINIFFLF